jgi:hypothetical protein
MKRVAALLFALCATSFARADVGPPPGKKVVPVTTVVEVTEDFPDFAFFAVTFSSTPGPPPYGGSSSSPTLHFFVPGTTIKWTGGRRSGGGLYAIPRAEAEKDLYWKGYLKRFEEQNPRKHTSIGTSDEVWVARAGAVAKGEIPGAVSTRFGGSEQLPVSDPREAITETFRVVRTPAGVAFVKPDAPPQDGRAEGDPALDPPAAFPWKWVAVGALASVGVILGGVWLIVRNRA